MADTKTRITMPCDIEARLKRPERRAAWHRDCPEPRTCPCPAHGHDAEAQR